MIVPMLIALILRSTACAALLNAASASEALVTPHSGDAVLSGILVTALTKHHIPGMGILVLRSAGVQAVAVAGWRKAGDPTPVMIDDQWHLGSCTKMMTATLIAKLVEDKRLRWDAPVSSLAHAGTTVDAAWTGITLDHLLCHRAGLSANLDWQVLTTRTAVVQSVLPQPPPLPVGEFSYSNTGYVLAGAWCEQLTATPWETLIAAEIWKPLGITHAGFGGLGHPGQVDQPWGHLADGTPAGNGPAADNPEVLGPAGRVHLPLADWALFIRDQLRGARNQPALLTPASYRHLHTAWPTGDDARGWVVVNGQPWAKGPALYHNGSNTMHYAVVWMAPTADLAILVTANHGTADPACDEAAAAAITAFQNK